MAYVTGTATDSIDFWSKLITFLTANATLVGASQEWEQVWSADSGKQVVLKGTGLAGADTIYVGMVRTDTVDTDNKSITFYGLTGVNPTAVTMSGHVNVSSGVRIWLDGGAMKYWFSATGRRFMVVANISTVYQTAYAGMFLPYALPTAYPSPIFIGATASLASEITSWRSLSNYHAAFPFAPYNSAGGANKHNAYMLGPDALWRGVAADEDANICIGPNSYATEDANGDNDFHLSHTASAGENSTGYLPVRSRIMRGYGDTYAIDPVTLIQTEPGEQSHGILDGMYVCSGVGNASENILSIGSVDYLVVQNAYRTSSTDYIAIRLE